MGQFLTIFFGWILGILSYFIFQWNERKHKIQDFKTGLLEELKEVLPELAMARYLIQNSIGELDLETVRWIKDALSTGNKDILAPEMIEGFEKLVNVPDDQLQAFSKLQQSDSNKGMSFKRYYLPFLDSNINIVPLLDIELQRLIFRMRRYFHKLEQEVEMYTFYFRKTFDPPSMAVNSDILKTNQLASRRSISILCLKTANEISSLIKKLESKK
jgi:hypothetical protein